MNNIDIHQLDPARQVLFILNEGSGPVSAKEIKNKLLTHRISIESKEMKSFLSNTLTDKRKRFIKNGLVYISEDGLQIMQKGIEYLESTVIVIDPMGERNTQETIGDILSNLSGDIRICDPYFDDAAYSLLKSHLNTRKIKSIKIIYSKNRFDSAKIYKIGNHAVEIKKSKSGIHDRFLMDKDCLYFFGKSLNSTDTRLSFIFNLTIYRSKFLDIFQNYWEKF